MFFYVDFSEVFVMNFYSIHMVKLMKYRLVDDKRMENCLD